MEKYGDDMAITIQRAIAIASAALDEAINAVGEIVWTQQLTPEVELLERVLIKIEDARVELSRAANGR